MTDTSAPFKLLLRDHPPADHRPVADHFVPHHDADAYLGLVHPSTTRSHYPNGVRCTACGFWAFGHLRRNGKPTVSLQRLFDAHIDLLSMFAFGPPEPELIAMVRQPRGTNFDCWLQHRMEFDRPAYSQIADLILNGTEPTTQLYTAAMHRPWRVQRIATTSHQPLRPIEFHPTREEAIYVTHYRLTKKYGPERVEIPNGRDSASDLPTAPTPDLATYIRRFSKDAHNATSVHEVVSKLQEIDQLEAAITMLTTLREELQARLALTTLTT